MSYDTVQRAFNVIRQVVCYIPFCLFSNDEIDDDTVYARYEVTPQDEDEMSNWSPSWSTVFPGLEYTEES